MKHQTLNKQEFFPHSYFQELRLFAPAYCTFLSMENNIIINFLNILHCSRWKTRKKKRKGK